MQSPEAQAVLQHLFDAGSRPHIEGVHVEESSPGSDCLAILTSGWRDATYVRPTPTGRAPVATSEMGPEPTEVVVEGGEHRWDLCFTNAGEVGWEGWWWGGYGDLIGGMAEVSGERPYVATRPVGATQPFTSTQWGLAFDVPAGWVSVDSGSTLAQSYNAVDDVQGMREDWAEIDVTTNRQSLEEAEAAYRDLPGSEYVRKLERTTIGPHHYAALIADLETPLGPYSGVAIDLGGEIYHLMCTCDLATLLPIAETIRPASPAP